VVTDRGEDVSKDVEANERGRTGRRVLIALGMAAPVLAAAALIPAVAVGGDERATHDHASHEHSATGAGLGDELAQVRRATAKFHRLDAAIAAGYELGWVNGAGTRIVDTCVKHPNNPAAGAMGFHYFNAALMADNVVSADEPEVLVYAPTSDGGRELVAVEWVVRGADSNPPGVSEAPSVLGMDMHILVPKPGPAFYLMHGWIWRDNPSGIFADWNPDVTC
jgi:hypothetical protein